MEVIEIMRKFKMGDHISYVNYDENKAEEYFAAFLAIGFERKEKCVFLTAETSTAKIAQNLMKFGVNIDSYLDTGQLELLSAKKYFLDVNFGSDRVINQGIGLIEKAFAQGYVGLRIISESGWLDDSITIEQFSGYEEEMQRVISSSPCIALCQYRVEKEEIDLIKSILNNHQYVFLDNGQDVNCFSSEELLRSGQAVDFLHESIKDLTKVNQSCRHMSFINDLTSTVMYRSGVQTAVQRALEYCAEEFNANVGLCLHFDTESKRLRYSATYGMDSQEIGESISGPMLASIYAHLSVVQPYMTAAAQECILHQLWSKYKIGCLGVIPLRNGQSIVGITFLGWKCSQVAYGIELGLISEILSAVNMALDVNYIQEKEFQQRKDAEKLEALGTLTGGISHEFNNILAVILGNCQLLQLKAKDAQLAKYIADINKSAHDAANLVQRLQNYCRPKVACERVPVQVNNIIASALEIARERWVSHSIPVNLQVNTNLQSSTMVSGNESELREVVVNLVINAWDAMPEGGRVTITTEDQEEKVVIFVADTGIGMSPEDAKRAFDPFFSTKFERGTGLGLTLSRNIIKAHNGFIDLNTEKGRGSLFTITLPEEKVTEANPEIGIADSKKYNIMVVDDDIQVLESVSGQLMALGHSVSMFNNTAELLAQVCRRDDVDLVITDLSMPGTTGIDLARKLKEIGNIPVILMSGWFDGFRYYLERGTVEGILHKPFTIKELEKLIDQVMVNRQRHRNLKLSTVN